MSSRFVSVLASLVLAAAAAAQTTTLTYQGRLKNAGEPAAGLHDFRFRLFDAAQGGTQLGDTQCVNNIAVAEGLFSTSIDFGQQFATPDGRFLEIQVREDTGLGCNNATGFVTLTPRQPLTAAPLASHANSAFALDAADGGPANAVFVDDAGRVGIGTQTPGHSVTVAAPAPTIALQDTDGNSTQVGYISYRNSDDAEMAWAGYGSPGSPHFSIVNARSGGNIALFPFSGGVGIGTDSPKSALEVRGDIRMGASGELRSPGSVENLRVVRGTVAAEGTKIAGDGFSCSRTDTGKYLIIFTTPFGQLPTVTASADAAFNEAAWFLAMPDNVSTHQSDVYTVSVSDNRKDRAFHFFAVGPR